MTLPEEIGDAAQDADRDRVMAWLEGGGSINDVDAYGFTLLICCACGDREDGSVNAQHVALARHLIALGADFTLATSCGYTAFHYIVQRNGERQAVLEMLSLLLGAGANVNASDSEGETPLYCAIWHASGAMRTTVITELLRAGVSLDACHGDNGAVEDVIHSAEYDMDLEENEDWLATKRLVAGVRKYGTYKKYVRAPHRDVLAVRGLAQRGKLSTNDPVVNFLARLGDNGVVWHVLEYWRATN